MLKTTLRIIRLLTLMQDTIVYWQAGTHTPFTSLWILLVTLTIQKRHQHSFMIHYYIVKNLRMFESKSVFVKHDYRPLDIFTISGSLQYVWHACFHWQSTRRACMINRKTAWKRMLRRTRNSYVLKWTGTPFAVTGLFIVKTLRS